MKRNATRPEVVYEFLDDRATHEWLKLLAGTDAAAITASHVISVVPSDEIGKNTNTPTPTDFT